MVSCGDVIWIQETTSPERDQSTGQSLNCTISSMRLGITYKIVHDDQAVQIVDSDFSLGGDVVGFKYFCHSPYRLEGASCLAYCEEGDTWDANAEECVATPVQQTCATRGQRPIDFSNGHKYRDEKVQTTGARYPFTLSYHYSNFGNNERTPSGLKVQAAGRGKYLAATKSAMNFEQYASEYTPEGLARDTYTHSSSQAYGSISQFWRHNFDEVLINAGGNFYFHKANGETIQFNGLGASTVYPNLELAPVSAGDDAAIAYILIINVA